MTIHELKTDRGHEDQAYLKLLQRVAVKDRLAFEQLYEELHPKLTRYLNRLVRRPELVEELVSDTLYVVWEKAADFQGRSKVTTWIIGIAYLKGIKALDRLKRMPEQQAMEYAEDEREDQCDLIKRIGLQDWLASGLEQISADQRSVVELTYFYGCSYQEIAEIMDCPVNTVKTRMFHARRKLEVLLPALAGQSLRDDWTGPLAKGSDQQPDKFRSAAADHDQEAQRDDR